VVIGKGMQVMIHEKRVKEKNEIKMHDARLPIMALRLLVAINWLTGMTFDYLTSCGTSSQDS
jgi:hypothetical protein